MGVGSAEKCYVARDAVRVMTLPYSDGGERWVLLAETFLILCLLLDSRCLIENRRPCRKGVEPRVSLKAGSTYDVIHDIDGDVWVPCHYDL